MVIKLTEAQVNSMKSDSYFITLAGALEKVNQDLAKKGWQLVDDNQFDTFIYGGIPYGGVKRATIDFQDRTGRIGHMHVVITNLSEVGHPRTKPYELVNYFAGWKKTPRGKTLHEAQEPLYEYDCILAVKTTATDAEEALDKAKWFVNHLKQEHPTTKAKLGEVPKQLSSKETQGTFPFSFKINIKVLTPKETEQKADAQKLVTHLNGIHGKEYPSRVFWVADAPKNLKKQV